LRTLQAVVGAGRKIQDFDWHVLELRWDRTLDSRLFPYYNWHFRLHEELEVIDENLRRLSQRLLGCDGPIGLNLKDQLIVVRSFAYSGLFDLEVHTPE